MELFNRNPLSLIAVMALLSILPMLLLATTSFVKISVVLNIFKNATGINQILSGMITGILSILLTCHVMTPVVQEMWTILQAKFIHENILQEVNPSSDRKSITAEFASIKSLLQVLYEVINPLQVFLRRHANLEERRFFADYKDVQKYNNNLEQTTYNPEKVEEEQGDLDCDVGGANKEMDCSFKNETLISLVSAFFISELKQAFIMGFAIYLPFLVIDLSVSIILLGMGMSALNPNTVTVPLKLIVFASTDGWLLLSRSLILSY